MPTLIQERDECRRALLLLPPPPPPLLLLRGSGLRALARGLRIRSLTHPPPLHTHTPHVRTHAASVCREVCKQAYEKIKDLRAAHDGRWQEYKTQSSLFRLQLDEDRKKR